MTPEEEEEAIRTRVFELMRELPSKQACANRIKAEGHSPLRVDSIVEELFRLRKTVATERLQRNEDIGKVMFQALDQDGPVDLPNDPEFQKLAHVFAARFRKERLRAKVVIACTTVAIFLLAIPCAMRPDVALAVTFMSVKYPCFGIFLVGLMLPTIYAFISACRTWTGSKRRIRNLDEISRRWNWGPSD